MKTIEIDARTYHQPETTDELKGLLEQAVAAKQKIAVRGSGHSFPLVKTNEGEADCLFIMLTYLNRITAFDHEKGIVTVQAGCHIGKDPNDETSTYENSLVYQLDPFVEEKSGLLGLWGKTNRPRSQAPGWALPDMGGISHQTMGGFMATGSSGGSTQFAFEDVITSVDIMHYDGSQVVTSTFTRPTDKTKFDTDPFFATAFVNLGLMGIVTSITIQCVPAFDINIVETTSHYEQCEIDLFGTTGDPTKSLQAFLQQSDYAYSRFLWWPQKDIQLIDLWKAQRTDTIAKSYKPYSEVPGIKVLTQLLTDAMWSLVGNWPSWLVSLYGLFGHDKQTIEEIKEFAAGKNAFFLKQLLKLIQPPGTQNFNDVWWNSLPMDNGVSDNLIPVWFTELWISIDQTETVMKDLKTFFESDPENAGTFSTEVYAARSSDFWLSPAYKTDVVRIDVFWFGHNAGHPQDYYQRFWTHLAPYNYRPHWAKYLPAGNSAQGVDYLSNPKIYPKWNDWLAQRAKMDPENLFLTDYWKGQLFPLAV